MVIERVFVKLDALHSTNNEAILLNLDQCEKYNPDIGSLL
jgi:hypothetical protein